MATDDTDKRLDSDISLGPEPMSAIVDGEASEVLGYATMYTIGEATVPRDWLVNRCQELGLPEYLVPGKPWPSSAYKRAMRRLVTKRNNTTWVDNRRVEFRLEDLDDSPANVRHLEAAVYFNEAETGTEGGEVVHHTLGVFDYDAETQSVQSFEKLDEEEQVYEQLHPKWETFVERAHELFEKMQVHHNGDDIYSMVYNLIHDHTQTSIKLRDAGGVYFFPVQLGETLEAVSKLLNDVDVKYKHRGRKMGLRTMTVVNSPEEREWIQERVEMELEAAVDKVIAQAFEELEEGETASDIVNMVLEQLSGSVETAEQYNDLLEAELSIEEFLEQKRSQITEEKRDEILERVLEERGE